MMIFLSFRWMLRLLGIVVIFSVHISLKNIYSTDDDGLFAKILTMQSSLVRLHKRLCNLKDLLSHWKVVDTTMLAQLALDMKYYKTTNVNFHSGHLYEHSLWVAMVIDRWFEEYAGNIRPENAWENGSSWIDGVQERDRSIAVLAAFLHDIGKVGSSSYAYTMHHCEYFNTSQLRLASYPSYFALPSHPSDGFKILTFQTHYHCSITPLGSHKFSAALHSGKLFDFKKFFTDLRLSLEEQKIIQILVGIHWDFGGDIMMQKNYEAFLQKLAFLVKKVSYNAGVVDERIIRLAVLIGAADVRAAQPQSLDDFDNFKRRYPWFVDEVFEPPMPHGQYKHAKTRYEAFEYPTQGVERRKYLIKYFKKALKQRNHGDYASVEV